MTDRDAFLAALAANEDDDATRLIFADWLDEQGQHEEADRHRKWRGAKDWLLGLCDECYMEPAGEYIPDLSYPALLQAAADALRTIGEGAENTYIECGANEDFAEALRGCSPLFWRQVSILTGIPSPNDAEQRIPFGCSC